ncbi:hypothetical protein RND81_09G060400 [Saponaria officinalis]|uniref:Uncharacterized protein n=1 Tax=Saponaria officinalis TaxID=3572 RepID=A0AAW1IHA0_SAPOF
MVLYVFIAAVALFFFAIAVNLLDIVRMNWNTIFEIDETVKRVNEREGCVFQKWLQQMPFPPLPSSLHHVKLGLAGKDALKEDDLDELTSDSFPKDFDVSSISGSEEEHDRVPRALNNINETLVRSVK